MNLKLVVASSLVLAVGCVPPPKKEHVELWAMGAAASSEGSTGVDFSAVQATGGPDVGGCLDSPLAWTPATTDAPMQTSEWNEFLELTYESYVFVEAVRVYETFNPGTIVRIDVEASDGSVPALNLYYDLNGDPGACPSVLATYVDQGHTYDQYNRVVIYLNTNLISNGMGAPNDFNAIDAVQLVGERYVD